jgi:hypothetical protein
MCHYVVQTENGGGHHFSFISDYSTNLHTMKRSKPPEKKVEDKPSFICSLSGVRVFGGYGYALRINEIDYPISKASYERICHDVGFSREGRIGDPSVIQIRRIIDNRGDVENDLDFLIDAPKLVALDGWKRRARRMIRGATMYSMQPACLSARRSTASAAFLDDDGPQPDIVIRD